MDTTQERERERHTTSSIAEQELFFSQSPSGQGQPQSGQRQQQQSQPRWYDNANDDSPVEPRGGVPAVNIIPATPSTLRSNSVRSNLSWRDRDAENRQAAAAAAGALPEVEEEDSIYDPPSTKRPSTPPTEYKVPTHHTASTFDSPTQTRVDEDYYVSPMTEPAVLHRDTGFTRTDSFDSKPAEVSSERYYNATYYPQNEQPSSFDKGKAVETHPEPAVPYYRTEHSNVNERRSSFDKGKAAEAHPHFEDQPPVPNPRPVSDIPDFYAQERGAYGTTDLTVQEQEDRDYAMALALQEEEEDQSPSLPQRHTQPAWNSNGPLSSNPFSSPEDQDRALAERLQEEEESGPPPPLPARPHPKAVAELLAQSQEPAPFSRTPSVEGIMPPPKRQGSDFGNDDPSNPIHYSRDPHKLITYLVPFPKPWLASKAPSDTDAMPTRFLIYTPPPPPLQAPPEGVKEGVSHKVQRKWQTEVRQAKMSDAKTTSWAGFKAKCTRGVDKAMQYTTTSNLDYLARVTPPPKPPSALSRKLSLKGRVKKDKKDKQASGDEKETKKSLDEKKRESSDNRGDAEKLLRDDEKKSSEDKGADERARDEKKRAEEKGDREEEEEDGFQSRQAEKDEHDESMEDDPAHASHETKKTVGVEEIVFVYSPSMNMTPEAMREEFINSMLRTKSKAQRDAIIATGLLPVSLAIDTVMIAVSGLFEVNAVWAYFTIKGSKTARSVTKRIASSSKRPESIDPEKSEAELAKEDKLQLSFKPANRIDVLSRYLEAECHRVDSKLFPRYTSSPTEAECLEAIGWSPALTRGQKNWEDEAWEVNDVKEDLRVVMHKAAKEWRKWCNRYEKNPEKSLSK
ncbi:hypothetical protein CORC01_01608 [Colletotrichum orchidophilum]|uniref:Secreted protein n=1 Tax=Colletotrichum orchidophilum TaxID=1209926 RepID=A0A1G4BP69_9PEZI|nr:uncharacterized protein CORC01_01608 [Colletotrichum orchidophilum]OHF03224.1 hypothetical protein CORC01_01608 [Colletotrichum orchidophilum]